MLAWTGALFSIAAAALKKFYDVHKEGGIPDDMRLPFLVGVIVSAIVGSVVIAMFLRYLRSASL